MRAAGHTRRQWQWQWRPVVRDEQRDERRARNVPDGRQLLREKRCREGRLVHRHGGRGSESDGEHRRPLGQRLLLRPRGSGRHGALVLESSVRTTDSADVCRLSLRAYCCYGWIGHAFPSFGSLCMDLGSFVSSDFKPRISPRWSTAVYLLIDPQTPDRSPSVSLTMPIS